MARMRNPYDPTAPALKPFQVPGLEAGIAPTSGDGTFDDTYQGGEEYTPPSGNTGIGGTAGGNNPNPGQPPPELGATQPAPTNNSKLYGTLDQGKLDAARGGSTDSAKYEFLSAAGGQDSYDPGAILAKLQGGSNGARWQGWGAQGDKIRYSGDNLDPVFYGMREFDVLHDVENNGGWGWQNTAAPSGGGGVPAGPQSGGAGAGAGTQAGSPGSGTDLQALINSLMTSGGGFNQGIVDRRTENASTALRKQANSRKDSNRALLADRGLIGDGPEGQMYGNVDEDIADRFANEVSGIYADESENADSRMIEAMKLSGAISTADADRLLGYFRANNDFSLGSQRNNNDFTLGQGNVALGNFRAQNDYNLGLGQFGLDRDRLIADIEAGDTSSMIQLLELLMRGAQTSAGGQIQ